MSQYLAMGTTMGTLVAHQKPRPEKLVKVFSMEADREEYLGATQVDGAETCVSADDMTTGHFWTAFVPGRSTVFYC